MVDWITSRMGSAPGGDISFSFDGLQPGWAFFLWLALCALAIWLYYRPGLDISRSKKLALTILRVITLTVLVILLVGPAIVLVENEMIRRSLVVLLDVSASMDLEDQRSTDEDLQRASIAAGMSSPTAGIEAKAPNQAGALRDISRSELLRRLAANERLDLWTELNRGADIRFLGFGRQITELGEIPYGGSTNPWTASAAAEFFEGVKFEENLTAMGDALYEVLERTRAAPPAAVVVITDGANNSGLPPLEAGRLYQQEDVPLFIYGIGTTSAPDVLIEELVAPRIAYSEERVDFTARIRSRGFAGQSTQVILREGEEELDRQEITFTEDGIIEATLGFSPEEAGTRNLEIEVVPFEQEAGRENNLASQPLRVIDDRLKVLLIDQEPRWDYRYLLATLNRDRRLEVSTFLIQGDAGMHEEEDSPFLANLPQDRESLFSYDVIILGDVPPDALGAERIELLREWVGDVGGALIFLAGRQSNPLSYAGTPLEALLPVELRDINREQYEASLVPPHQLTLTNSGRSSNLLRLSENEEENLAIWNNFPPVRWNARNASQRRIAETLLVDATNPSDPVPIIALQRFGAGQSIYFGIDETYRWRSGVGETYYIRIWGQIMQSLTLDRQSGASQLTQLRSDRPRYYIGDNAVISGQLYQANFEPMDVPSVEAVVRVAGTNGEDAGQESVVQLIAVPGQPGEYSVEIPVTVEGEYSLSTRMDPDGIVRWESVEPRVELLDTAMNEEMLQGLAQTSGGRFLREENLHELAGAINAASSTRQIEQRKPLYFHIWWAAIIFLMVAIEWSLRRIWQLK